MLGFNKQDVRLASNLFKMNIRDRYLGSSLGSFWAIVNPLLMLGMYTFVFGFVFKVRLPGAETTLTYVVWLISGYGPWIAITESIMASATSVVGAAGIVKNMAFKTELLPISAAFVGLINLLVSFCFLFILMIFAGNQPSWHALWLPLIIVIQFFFIIALGLWLSAINVFIRDLTQALPNILTMILFGSPIFYAMESMPNLIQKVSNANPFYLVTDAYRKVLVEHQNPSFEHLAYLTILSSCIFFFGLAAFRRVKGSFDAVL
ncbi:MAG TPA: ABC transporter permease [Methylobacter sp.]|jgi:lipopolysaccharide transport system permease protein